MSAPEQPRAGRVLSDSGSSRMSGLPGADERPLPPELDPRGRGGRGRGSEPVLPARRRRRWGRLLSWVALGLSVVVFAVAALGYVFYRNYNSNITRIPGLSRALPGLAKPAAAPHDARNVLIVGSDTRDTTGDEFQGTGAEFTTGQRSDTVILAHLYGDSEEAQLVSFPRDSWVSIPSYTDAATGKTTPQHEAKLNSAIDIGGPALLIATIEQLTDIRVDNYVQVDFAGFQNMVQALGGVEVCLTKPAKDKFSGIDLPAGRQTVQGAQALAFVRQRHGLPNGDIDRIKRQQAFIASITRKVLSSGTLLDPFKLNGFLNAATRSVTVDDSLSVSGLTALALRMKKFNAGGVIFTTVPVAQIDGRRQGQDVVLLDQAGMDTLFGALRQDRSPSEPATPSSTSTPATAPLTVPPSAVRVTVQNGAGVAGLARTAADDLARAGFTVTGAVGNAGSGAAQSVVRYGPSRADSARTVAAAVRGSKLELDPSLGSGIEVVVGSSYNGVLPVKVGDRGPVAPAPAVTAPAPAVPAPAAPAPAVTAADEGCVA